MAYVDTARQTWRQLRHDADDSNNGETEFNQMTDIQVSWIKDSADTTAGVVTTNNAVCRVPYTSRVISANWVQNAVTTANATSYATVTLNKDDGAASTAIAVGSFNTQSASLAARTTKALTLTAVNVQVASGGCLYINIGKTSSGKKLHPGCLTVVLRRV